MKQIINIFKNTFIGVLVGIANIIPGISGGTILALADMYENTVSDFATILKFQVRTELWKMALLNIAKLVVGIIAGLIVFSHVMSWMLDNAFRPTMIGIFVLMIISLVQYLIKFKPNINFKWLPFVVGITLPVGISIIRLLGVEFQVSESLIAIFITGVIASAAMILPGISGSMILLIVGTYNLFINTIKNLEVVNILVLGAGIIIGIFGAVIGIEKIYKTKKEQMNSFVCGLLISSLFALLITIYQGGK